jgi:glycosyltransferase involved in cell wall biosynthesis
MLSNHQNIQFTVAIPTYNGAIRLPEVLDKLRLQINTESIAWETLVVDNNSNDHTATIVRDYQAIWEQHCPLKYCFEPKQGAAFARQKAVEEARGALIGFIDDDNLPNLDWIAQAVNFAHLYLKAGAFGSQIHGLLESEPQFDLKKLACFLAIIERGDQAFCYQPAEKVLPPSAGLVVRREVWLESVPRELVLNYKGREEGLASEDIEALIHIQQAGWEIWYNPAMVIEHRIPSWRLEKDHLVSIVRCIGLSRNHLRMMRLRSWQKPLFSPIYWLNDLRKLMVHRFKYGGQVTEDIVLACERELLTSTLKSRSFLRRKKHESKN